MIPSAILTHAVVATIAFLAGYGAARLERVVQAGKSSTRRWADLGRIGLALLVVSIVAASQLQLASTNTCFFDYFEGVSTALAERSAATGASSRAQVEFLTTVRDGQPVEQGPAIDRYLAALGELEAARQAAPLPTPPSCG